MTDDEARRRTRPVAGRRRTRRSSAPTPSRAPRCSATRHRDGSAITTSPSPGTRAGTSTSCEKQKLWSRVWQMACRLEEIPEVGDTDALRDLRQVDPRSCAPAPTRSAPSGTRAVTAAVSWSPSPATSASCAVPSTGSPGTSTARSPSFPHAGTSRRSTMSKLGPRRSCASVRGPASCSSTRTPQCEELDDVPRRAGRSLRRLDARGPVHRGPRRQDLQGQLEGRPGSLHGGPPRRARPIPRCWYAWATSTVSTTATSTSAGA